MEICLRLEATETTFYRWKRKYGGLGVSELRELRDENRRPICATYALELRFEIEGDFLLVEAGRSGITQAKPLTSELHFESFTILTRWGGRMSSTAQVPGGASAVSLDPSVNG